MNINYFDEDNNGLNSNERVVDNTPTEEDIIAKQEKERANAALRQGYAFLGKWIFYYFILIVPSIVAGVLQAIDTVPTMVLIGNIISIAVSVASIVILIKLGDYDKNYRTAGLLTIPGFIFNLIEVIAFYGVDVPLWYSGIGIVVGIIGMYATYLEIKTHAYITATVDPMLSASWTKLWKWILICTIGTICSAFLILIPFLGALLLIGFAIGLVVVSIIKLVYLYRTAKLFQALSY